MSLFASQTQSVKHSSDSLRFHNLCDAKGNVTKNYWKSPSVFVLCLVRSMKSTYCFISHTVCRKRYLSDAPRQLMAVLDSNRALCASNDSFFLCTFISSCCGYAIRFPWIFLLIILSRFICALLN